MLAARSHSLARSRLVRTLATAADGLAVPPEYTSRAPPYPQLITKLATVRRLLGDKPLTLAEKILYSHLCDPEELLASAGSPANVRGQQYLKLHPDRVAMQDALAQMALLQFMTCGMALTAVPALIHCDHLIVGRDGADLDLHRSIATNKEVFDFLQLCGEKYGIQFWGPGSGIIHQIVLENFLVPGLMMLGTDLHTPNAGGLGAIAIGVGGADAVDALTGTPWELRAPRVLGVKLTGALLGWTTPKDVITHLAGLLTVRGGTGYIVEYFGDGVELLLCTGMATICNMGAEIGATTLTFPYQPAHKRYLELTGRGPIAAAADVANARHQFLRADSGAEYDHVVEINLLTLEPHVNGPFTPDLLTPILQFGARATEQGWPQHIALGLIGLCTNLSYQDMLRAVSIMRQAEQAGLKPKIPFLVTPGLEQIRATIERDGHIETFERNGAVVLANACGPCIGQWDRSAENQRDADGNASNAIFTSFNRNFRARNDGNRDTMNFLTSPDIVTAMIYLGDAQFNPLTDSIALPNGESFKFDPPLGDELPQHGFVAGRPEFYPEAAPQPKRDIEVNVARDLDRLQLLEPFAAWDGHELSTHVLLKVEGKCTTDHILAAGAWLKYKGHLENISNNTLIGAVNRETGEVNTAYDADGSRHGIPELMIKWKAEHKPWAVVAEHNYGEGSAREHAALSPRFLGGRVILVKSFARIHETNLKKQGMLPLTFADEADYDRIGANDVLTTVDLADMVARGGDNGGVVRVRVRKPDGAEFDIACKHTMSPDQVEFFKAGSAINYIGNLRRERDQAL